MTINSGAGDGSAFLSVGGTAGYRFIFPESVSKLPPGEYVMKTKLTKHVEGGLSILLYQEPEAPRPSEAKAEGRGEGCTCGTPEGCLHDDDCDLID